MIHFCQATTFFETVIVPEMFHREYFKQNLSNSIIQGLLDKVHDLVTTPQPTVLSSNVSDIATFVDFDTAAVVEVNSNFFCEFCSLVCINDPKKT